MKAVSGAVLIVSADGVHSGVVSVMRFLPANPARQRFGIVAVKHRDADEDKPGKIPSAVLEFAIAGT
jgi:DNA-binding helix-hairpin-helix protein with protein kinase domain